MGAEAISDRAVAATLRPIVRAATPLVRTLRESDPFKLRDRQPPQDDLADVEPTRRQRLLEALARMRVPGSDEWDRMNPRQRSDWWINRVGRFTAVVAAAPGLAGALSDRLPIQDTLGVATQAVLLCAIAAEHGVTDLGEQVRLLAWVLFDRYIAPEVAAGKGAGYDKAAEDAETARLGEGLADTKGRGRLRGAAAAVWRFGRSLLSISGELDKRPSGRMPHEALGMLPVVGIVGDYLGERSGLKRVATRAHRWLDARQ